MSPVGLTYRSGESIGATIESAALGRVAGQFASPFLSCPVRGSGPGRVQLTVGSMLSATSGAVVLFCDPDNANDGGGQQANGLLFCWRASAAERIELEYTKGSTVLTARRLTASAGATATASLTFAAGDPLAVLIAWDATTLYVAANGGTIATAGNTSIPVGLPTTLDIGSQDGATAATYFNAAYGQVLLFSAPLSATQWQTLASLRSSRPACLGEGGTDALATGGWLGADSRVVSIPTGGTVLDLNDAAGSDIFLLEQGLRGAGVPATVNRSVETPLRDGAAYVDTRFGPRMVYAPLLIKATAQLADLWTTRRQVVAAMNPKRGEGILSYAPSNVLYEATAIVEAALGFQEPLASLAQLPIVQFRCNDPAWRVAARNDSLITIVPGGWSIAWTIPWEITPSNVTTVIANDGDLDSYPVITLTAGASGLEDPFANNDTTGRVFRLRGLTLLTGESVTIDMSARTATHSDGTNVLGYRTSDSRMWPIVRGSNSLMVGGAAGAGTVTIEYFTRYAGV